MLSEKKFCGSKVSFNYPTWARTRMARISAAVILLGTSQAFAAAPAVVVDAQQTIGTGNLVGNFNPSQVAVAPNGTVYVADTSNNRVLQFIPGLPGAVTPTVVNTGGLSSPQGLAVDAAGDLYVADNPVVDIIFAQVRIIEVVANNGILTNTVNTIYQGGVFVAPSSLAIDSANTLYLGQVQFFGGGQIFSIAAGTGTLRTVNTGLSGFTPSAMAVGSGTLYFVDSGSNAGGVFSVPTGGGSAASIGTGSFNISAPSGLALDASGNLFIMATIGRANNQQIIEVPASSPSTPYLIPNTLNGLDTMGIDPLGNLDVAGLGYVDQLNFSNPVGMGSVNTFAKGTAIQFNFEYNAPATITGFRAVTRGDQGTSTNTALADVVVGTTGNCVNKTLPNSTTAYAPATCNQTFQATPQYSGIRASAIQVKGTSPTLLSSTPVYETGLSAAQITYPVDATTTATGMIEPQGITASGFDQKVYVADLLGGTVYLVTGVAGSTKQAISTGTIALSQPADVAVNAEGDLYIADYEKGRVVVVPAAPGAAPYVLNTGTLLLHPISLTVDFLGDLYIGDSGPDGVDGTSSAPGYIVEVPYKGSAFKLPTPGITVIFPQVLAADPITGNLFVGDGGDNATVGQIVKVPASGANASVVTVTGVAQPTDPSGLAFDPAENLYALDSFADTITVIPAAGGASHLLTFDGSALMSPAEMAFSAGSQSLVISNIGNGNNNNSLVFLNGNSSTLAFGNQGKGTTSAAMTATVANIGNQNLVLPNKYNTITKSSSAFTILGTSNCANKTLTASTTCSVNVQFAPTTTGAQSEQMTINSSAYNTNIPLMTFSGTGTTGSVTPGFSANVSTGAQVNPHAIQSRRKSLQDAVRKAKQR
jgi:sugar lactone lactonase YvrE